METKSGSVIGQLVMFNRKKTYTPNACHVVRTFGYVVDYLYNGAFVVVYSYPCGEYGEEMIHASKLYPICDEVKEDAINSATRWANKVQEHLLEQIVYFTEKKDEASVRNLRKKNNWINNILSKF